MENKKYENWLKIIIGLAVLSIAIAVLYIYSNPLDSKISGIKMEDKLEVSIPKYLDFEEIKTNDSLIEKNSKYKYSQVKVKNTSDETVYDISINLKEQATNESDTYIVTSYHIYILKPGETALLSVHHENTKDDNVLRVANYYYTDTQGHSFTVNRESVFNPSQPKNTPKGIVTVDADETNQLKKVTDEIRRINIKDTRIIKKDEQQYLEVDIENISDKNIQSANINFVESYNGNIIGNLIGYIGKLKPNQIKTIKLDYKNDVEIKLIGYDYKIYDNKVTYVYDVFLEEELYRTYDYEDLTVSNNKNVIISISNFIVIFICWIIKIIVKELNEKGISENNETYIRRAKYLNILKIAIFILYAIGMLIYIEFFLFLF
jgi:hypothetical protein